MPRPKGSSNKLTSEIKERLSQVVMDAMSTIDIDLMTQNEKLKLIQIGLTYVVPRLKHTEEIKEEPRNFQIVRSMIKSLQDGWKVVIWPDSIISKDINDMVQSSIRDARLVEIINRNTYSGQRGEWEVHSWKKV